LRRDGIADKSALVGQLIEEFRKLVLDLEGHDLSFGLFIGHKNNVILWASA